MSQTFSSLCLKCYCIGALYIVPLCLRALVVKFLCSGEIISK